MIFAQQVNALPRISPSQVSSYPQQVSSFPQQSSYVPAVRTLEATTDPIGGIMPMMISLIVIVMVMKMMTKITDNV